MVELAIKIDENVFTRLFDNGIQDNEISVDDVCEMARALRMGTPLEEIPNPCIECSQNCCVRELDGEKCECQKVYVRKGENKE